MLCVVGAPVWLRKLESIQSNAGEVGGHRNVVHKENAQSSMDSENNKHECDVESKYLQKAGHHNSAKTAEVPGPCIKRKDIGKGLLAGCS